MNVSEDFGFPRGLIHLESQFLLRPADRERAFRASAQEFHERFIELVNPLSKRVDLGYSALFSHRT